MPPKPRYNKEEIVDAAFAIAREEGIDAVVAREVGKRLGTSVAPIFTAFEGMEELRKEVRGRAVGVFEQYVADAFEHTPAFKHFGMRFVDFAKEEPKLFQLLFLWGKKENEDLQDFARDFASTYRKCIDVIRRDYELDEEKAETLFSHVWVYALGLSVLIAGGIYRFRKHQISEMLSQAFMGEMMRLTFGENLSFEDTSDVRSLSGKLREIAKG